MSVEAVTESERIGVVRHSRADISRAKELLGYNPSHTVELGVKDTVEWFVKQKSKRYAAENRGHDPPVPGWKD
jgi:UDP-N-acetylglucosamine 4-epimerase